MPSARLPSRDPCLRVSMDGDSDHIPAAPDPIRVIVVDDNEDFRESLIKYLARLPSLAVAGNASSATSALRLTRHLKPDLVLLDYSMPGGNGVEACRALKTLPAPPKVIMVTMLDGEQFRHLSATAGADGFITKIELHDELPATLARLFSSSDNNDQDSRGNSHTP